MRIGIVTGASRGIGKTFAVKLANSHPDLDEIWCISRTGNDEIFNNCGSVRIRYFQLDQSDACFYSELKAMVVQSDVNVVYLIANAATAIAGTVLDQPFEEVDQMVQTNIRGTLAAVYAIAPLMQRGSRIVLVSSISADVPTPGLAVYTSTKAFIRHWGLSLRNELRSRGVSVTIVLPGKVQTSALVDVVKRTGSWKLKLMLYQSVDYLVWRSLRAADRGQAIVTPGVYSVVSWLFKLLPTRLVARMSSLAK
ncbi:MAG: SDR family NAD(P)-dependent oxidoreductase [Corynebacterium sp.]|uniref:SDR family NAD(P)-dependent oxidoreductase n=1 Tax=Corynebacterium sp. TaxID=1720 RepID=UPI0026DCCD3D|nr:SDR family NAD(P)-dependent oxidoreductase [Corynebacterium sp.]MDO5029999.1 SDR family NAD(P)-dependent oxidoreductase [Corynebacterium sp.]